MRVDAKLVEGLSPAQLQLLRAEFRLVEKSATTGMLLAILLGGFGAHRFYLRDLWGFLYVIFCWTFIPMIVGFVEAFVMTARVEAYNRQQIELLVARIRVR